jgi:hypothetical protein
MYQQLESWIGILRHKAKVLKRYQIAELKKH